MQGSFVNRKSVALGKYNRQQHTSGNIPISIKQNFIKKNQETRCPKMQPINGLVKSAEALLKSKLEMAKKHKETCSTSLGFREIQINTTTRLHFSSVKMSTVETNADERKTKGTLKQSW